jgi:hypothetical protein
LDVTALADVEGLNMVYEIVTNYKQWYFFRSLDSRIERDEATIHTKFSHDIPTRESVKGIIAERIYAMHNSIFAGSLPLLQNQFLNRTFQSF